MSRWALECRLVVPVSSSVHLMTTMLSDKRMINRNKMMASRDYRVAANRPDWGVTRCPLGVAKWMRLLEYLRHIVSLYYKRAFRTIPASLRCWQTLIYNGATTSQNKFQAVIFNHRKVTSSMATTHEPAERPTVFLELLLSINHWY